MNTNKHEVTDSEGNGSENRRTDEQLMVEFCQGSREAFSELLARTSSRCLDSFVAVWPIPRKPKN